MKRILMTSRCRRSWLCLMMILSGGAFIADALGQRPGSGSEKSYRQARRVLEKGIDALGGLEALGKIEDVTVKFSGQSFARYQSVKADPPYSAHPLEATLVLDDRRGWGLFEQARSLPGGFDWRSRIIIKGDKGVALDLILKTVSPLRNTATFKTVARTRLPHVMLLTALDRDETLRWLGEEDYEGSRQNVIVFATSEGQQIALYFNAQTGLLTKYESLVADNFAGDAVQETIFPEYRTVAGIKVPARRIQKQAGEVTDDLTYTDVRLNTHPPESAFDTPPAFQQLPAPPPTTMKVKELARDVYFLEGVGDGYNILFVAFNDYVLVAEAPIGSAPSQTAIDKIKETIPNKPIKYLVVTHHHSDHAGGTRAFMAEGATLVTTPGNLALFERMAAARRTIDPDALSRHPRQPLIEVLKDGKRVFRDDKHTVEIHDIGPSPHANEMLIVYLPKEKILFQGDLLNLPDDGRIEPGNATTLHFAQKIHELGLDVERIAGVHSPVVAVNTLQQALDKMKALASLPTAKESASLVPVVSQNLTATQAQDLSPFFKDKNAAFVLYDLNHNRYLRYNEERCRQRLSPFSTFKIPNSLIGLETGVIKDADFVIHWNSRKYPPQEGWTTEPFIHWKQDQDLRSAIKYSVVWYYKELALRVGETAMKQYVTKLRYGNQDISGGLDKFWLGSSLKISADEQVEFLKALYHEQLPVSQRSMRIVKEIILREQTPSYKLSGKTGGGPSPDGKALGWFVGYLETKDNVYFFALNMEGADYLAIRDERINLTKRVLAGLGYLPKQ